MTFKLNNSIHKLYDYFLKHANIINNKLNKIKVFNYYIFKNKIMKIFISIIIFVLIFDKFTILFISGLFYGFKNYKNANTEHYNNFLSTSSVEHYYDNVKELSKVLKHPELNLNSYNNVRIDPEKVFLQDNKFLPECCFYNTDYSTSKGCACISPDQENYLLTRGTNKSHISFLQENNDYKNIYFSPTQTFHENKTSFINHDISYITSYEPLNDEKKNKFYELTNLLP